MPLGKIGSVLGKRKSSVVSRSVGLAIARLLLGSGTIQRFMSSKSRVNLTAACTTVSDFYRRTKSEFYGASVIRNRTSEQRTSQVNWSNFPREH